MYFYKKWDLLSDIRDNISRTRMGPVYKKAWTKVQLALT